MQLTFFSNLTKSSLTVFSKMKGMFEETKKKYSFFKNFSPSFIAWLKENFSGEIIFTLLKIFSSFFILALSQTKKIFLKNFETVSKTHKIISLFFNFKKGFEFFGTKIIQSILLKNFILILPPSPSSFSKFFSQKFLEQDLKV